MGHTKADFCYLDIPKQYGKLIGPDHCPSRWTAILLVFQNEQGDLTAIIFFVGIKEYCAERHRI